MSPLWTSRLVLSTFLRPVLCHIILQIEWWAKTTLIISVLWSVQWVLFNFFVCVAVKFECRESRTFTPNICTAIFPILHRRHEIITSFRPPTLFSLLWLSAPSVRSVYVRLTHNCTDNWVLHSIFLETCHLIVHGNGFDVSVEKKVCSLSLTNADAIVLSQVK